MGTDSRRIVIAAALSVLIMLAWQEFFMPKQKGRPVLGAPDAGAETARPAPQAAPAPAGPLPTAAPNAPEETATLETADFTATFSTWGGALKSLTLKGEKYRREEPGGKVVPVDLVRVAPGEPYPLALVPSPELGGPADLAADAAARTPMRLAAKDARSVTFEGRVGGVGVRKRFTVGDRPFEIDGEIAVFGAAQAGAVAVLYPGYMSPDVKKPGFFSTGEVVEVVTPVCRAGGKTARFDGKEAAEKLAGEVSWAGLDQHYFVSALLPEPKGGQCVFLRGASAGASMASWRVPVEGGAASLRFQLFAGPKRVDLLRSYSGRDLDTAIDYGPVTNFFAVFARWLLWIMQTFHALVKNWGVAIMLLTALVKLVLFPLTQRSMASMAEMRKLQPEIEKLKAKHGEDKEKLNVAVMQLYQQHKVNPLGGCLPMLFQMPIWLALYAALQTSVELYREPFLWIHDLTRYDPYYVLPLAMGASSFVMQKISPQPADSAQAKMLLYAMPICFTFIMLRLPAGLTLYILVNNLLSIGQQQLLLRRHGVTPAAKAA